MTCEEIRANLSAYIDGELNDEERRTVEAHMEGCNACAQRYEELVRLGHLVRSVERFEADEKEVLSIVSRAQRKSPSPEIVWFPVTIRVAVLAALIINIALFNLFRDYRFRSPSISAYKPIRVESVVEMETEPSVEVSFSFPAKDTVENFSAPEVINAVNPSYPKDLLSEEIEGTVVLNIIVDEEGVVGEVEVVRSLCPAADSFVIASATMLRFQPARIGTTAVEAVVILNYLFRI